MNPNSFEFISLVENVDIIEAKKILKDRNSSPFYIENWKSEEEYKKSQSRDINYYINKYGTDGEMKYKEHINKISHSNSIDRYINEFGDIEGRKIFESISLSKGSMSYKYFLNKNNNNKSLSLHEYNKRLESVNVSIDNWVKKYGEEIAIIKHKNRVKKYNKTFSNNPNKDKINKSKAITIKNLYNKYGDMVIAEEKYRNWLSKVTVPLCRASKESLLVFDDIIEYLLKNDIKISDIYIGDGESSEYFIRDGKKIFFYDFTIKSKK